MKIKTLLLLLVLTFVSVNASYVYDSNYISDHAILSDDRFPEIMIESLCLAQSGLCFVDALNDTIELDNAFIRFGYSGNAEIHHDYTGLGTYKLLIDIDTDFREGSFFNFFNTGKFPDLVLKIDDHYFSANDGNFILFKEDGELFLFVIEGTLVSYSNNLAVDRLDKFSLLHLDETRYKKYNGFVSKDLYEQYHRAKIDFIENDFDYGDVQNLHIMNELNFMQLTNGFQIVNAENLDSKYKKDYYIFRRFLAMRDSGLNDNDLMNSFVSDRDFQFDSEFELIEPCRDALPANMYLDDSVLNMNALSCLINFDYVYDYNSQGIFVSSQNGVLLDYDVNRAYFEYEDNLKFQSSTPYKLLNYIFEIDVESQLNYNPGDNGVYVSSDTGTLQVNFVDSIGYEYNVDLKPNEILFKSDGYSPHYIQSGDTITYFDSKSEITLKSGEDPVGALAKYGYAIDNPNAIDYSYSDNRFNLKGAAKLEYMDFEQSISPQLNIQGENFLLDSSDLDYSGNDVKLETGTVMHLSENGPQFYTTSDVGRFSDNLVLRGSFAAQNTDVTIDAEAVELNNLVSDNKQIILSDIERRNNLIQQVAEQKRSNSFRAFIILILFGIFAHRVFQKQKGPKTDEMNSQ